MKDWLARLWSWLGDQFKRRPLAVVGLLLGALLVSLFLYQQTQVENKVNKNTSSIHAVQKAFCNGSAPYTPMVERNCHKLLDQLLRNPTTEQAERLREIIKENP